MKTAHEQSHEIMELTGWRLLEKEVGQMDALMERFQAEYEAEVIEIVAIANGETEHEVIAAIKALREQQG